MCERGTVVFYTMEEAAVLCGFLELYLERADYEWAAATLGFLRPQWWPEHEDHRALENALLKTRTLASKKE